MASSLCVRSAMATLFSLTIASCAAPTALQHAEPPSPDPLMGDWQGHRVERSGDVLPVFVQVIALGGNTYEAIVEEEFGKRTDFPGPMKFRLEGDSIVFLDAEGFTAAYDGRTIRGVAQGKSSPASFQVQKLVRLSPTLGAQAPPGATVLFDGTSLAGWSRVSESADAPPAGWRLVDGGAMEVVKNSGSIVTKKKLTNFTMHLEFRTPFMPEERGQERGNSGVYLQGRYEIQVLDSYGLTGEDNECGGIYKVAKPRLNMCAPPGQWQTYDIVFRAPAFDASGTKIKDANLTLLHNGVVVHRNLAIPGPTGGPVDTNAQQPGGLMLQDHGTPVQYRNIWVVEQPN